MLFLALTDNCGEVRWDYSVSGELITNYVSVRDAEENLSISDLKAYGGSAERWRSCRETGADVGAGIISNGEQKQQEVTVCKISLIAYFAHANFVCVGYIVPERHDKP